MTMKKDGSLTKDELEAIKKAIQLKAKAINRPYLVNAERIVFMYLLSGYQYIVKIFNNARKRWEMYFVCPFGEVRMGTFKPPKSPLIAGY